MSSNKKSVTINKIIRVRMAMVYLIWRAMFGNGGAIGMTVLITTEELKTIPRACLKESSNPFAGGPGLIMPIP